jgi:peroxiredoxin
VIEPGSRAPDFTLRSQNGEKLSLSDFAGKSLVLAFYPADFSPICNDQLSIYQEILGELEARDTKLVGISVDGAFCHRAFAEKLGLTFPLLSDFHPKGEVSRAYGAYDEKYGVTNRSLVLIGEDGLVKWSHAEPSPLDIPGANLIFDALAAAA